MSNGTTNTKTRKSEAKSSSPGSRKTKAAKVKNISKLARSATVRGTPSVLSQKKVMKVLKVSGSSYGLQSVSFSDWVQMLAKPFTTQLVKCPVNFNPVPTLLTMPAVTVSTGTFSVEKNRSREVVLFPGHSEESSNDPMDGEAYHSIFSNIGGNNHVFGPVNVSIGQGTCMAISPNDSMAELPKPSLGAYTPAFWDNPLPFTTSTNDPGHLRWKLVAMGFRWKNINTALNRGGSVKTVQPPIAFCPTLVSSGGPGWGGYDRFPTYRLEISLDDQISWIPRIEDLSFWHVGTQNYDSNSNGGVRILFTAPDIEQNYEYELICKWEIGGTSVATISTAAELISSHKDTAEDMVTHLANTSHTAASAPGALNHVVQEKHAQKETILQQAKRLVEKGARAAVHHGVEMYSSQHT